MPRLMYSLLTDWLWVLDDCVNCQCETTDRDDVTIDVIGLHGNQHHPGDDVIHSGSSPALRMFHSPVIDSETKRLRCTTSVINYAIDQFLWFTLVFLIIAATDVQ